MRTGLLVGEAHSYRRAALLPGLGLLAAFVGWGLLGTSDARAAAIDINLIPVGAYVNDGDGQGSHFYTTDQQPTGTGVIKPFLTIQRKGTEQGYNTDAEIEPGFDMKRQANWTRSLLISELDAVSFNGGTYLKFLLDVNEPANGANSLISLNVLQLFVTNEAELKGYQGGSSFTVGETGDGFALATKVYDLDKVSDRTIQLEYRLESGSGSGDMYAYIPYSVLLGRTEKYLTLYSAFGIPYGSASGFEEWAVAARTPVEQSVPLPGVAVAGLVLLGGLGLKRLRRPA
jgi:hypothetical protein